MVTRGEVRGGWVKQVMGTKECTCYDEHWVMHGIAESLYRTPEPNATLYVKYIEIKMSGNKKLRTKPPNHIPS